MFCTAPRTICTMNNAVKAICVPMYKHYGVDPQWTQHIKRVLVLWDRAEMFILWGDSGSGKSTLVRRCVQHSAGTTDALYQLRYPKYGDLVRWEGFDPAVHTDVLLEEFTGQIEPDEIKQWVDKWPVRVRTFGGDRVVRPLRFWFTSNEHPHAWWKGAYRSSNNVHRQALDRRTTRSERLYLRDDPSIRYVDSDTFFSWYCQDHRPAEARQSGDQESDGDSGQVEPGPVLNDVNAPTH